MVFLSFCWPEAPHNFSSSSRTASDRDLFVSAEEHQAKPEPLSDTMKTSVMTSDTHSTASSQEEEEAPNSGELTPAVSNCSSLPVGGTQRECLAPAGGTQREWMVPGSPCSNLTEEEAEDNHSCGDSWEAIQDPDEEGPTQLDSPESAPISIPIPIVFKESYPPPVKLSSPPSKKKFVLLGTAALLLGILAATGVLHSLSKEQEVTDQEVTEQPPRKNAIIVSLPQPPKMNTTTTTSSTRTAKQAPAVSSFPTKKKKKQMSKPAATPQKESQNDSNNFLWLSLDDDVIAGPVFWETLQPQPEVQQATPRQVFWENETLQPQPVLQQASAFFKPKFAVSSKKEVRQAVRPSTITKTKLTNSSSSFWTEKRLLLGTIVDLYQLSTNHQQQQQPKGRPKKGPFHWIARHYQRLNVYVLGRSQLAQLKRRQYFMR